jgi:hypothetical protein
VETETGELEQLLRSLQYPPVYPKKYEKNPMLSEGK